MKFGGLTRSGRSSCGVMVMSGLMTMEPGETGVDGVLEESELDHVLNILDTFRRPPVLFDSDDPVWTVLTGEVIAVVEAVTGALRRFSSSQAWTLCVKWRTSWLLEVDVIRGLPEETEKGSLRSMG